MASVYFGRLKHWATWHDIGGNSQGMGEVSIQHGPLVRINALPRVAVQDAVSDGCVLMKNLLSLVAGRIPS